MDLVSLIIVLIVVGVLLWLVNNIIPMDANIKKIINVLVVIVVVPLADQRADRADPADPHWAGEVRAMTF